MLTWPYTVLSNLIIITQNIKKVLKSMVKSRYSLNVMKHPNASGKVWSAASLVSLFGCLFGCLFGFMAVLNVSLVESCQDVLKCYINIIVSLFIYLFSAASLDVFSPESPAASSAESSTASLAASLVFSAVWLECLLYCWKLSRSFEMSQKYANC